MDGRRGSRWRISTPSCNILSKTSKHSIQKTASILFGRLEVNQFNVCGLQRLGTAPLPHLSIYFLSAWRHCDKISQSFVSAYYKNWSRGRPGNKAVVFMSASQISNVNVVFSLSFIVGCLSTRLTQVDSCSGLLNNCRQLRTMERRWKLSPLVSPFLHSLLLSFSFHCL